MAILYIPNPTQYINWTTTLLAINIIEEKSSLMVC